MIDSELITEIIELTVEGEKFETLLFEQINHNLNLKIGGK